MSDASDYSSASDHVTIATIALQHEHDLIVLRRRLRSAADELNFEPEEDGHSLVRRIRAMRTQLANVPVVALTAFTQPEDRRRALRAGFRHLVPKPVEIDELAAVVRTVADQR